MKMAFLFHFMTQLLTDITLIHLCEVTVTVLCNVNTLIAERVYVIFHRTLQKLFNCYWLSNLNHSALLKLISNGKIDVK